MRTFLLLLSLAAGLAAYSQHDTLNTAVYFETDKSNLDHNSIAELDRLAMIAKQSGQYALILKGHTDSRASDAYNIGLSERRVEAVRMYLLSKGIDAGIMQTYGFGERQPVAPNSSEAGMQSNRRVEIALLILPKEPVSASLPNTTIQDLYKKLRGDVQTFTIRPGTETIIRGKNGTLFLIKPDCFMLYGEPVRDRDIEITLKEPYSYSEMLMENLTTTSDGEMLATAGMVYFNATSAGRQLSICEDGILAMMPTPLSGQQQLFSGSQTTDGTMNWNLQAENEVANASFFAMNYFGWFTENGSYWRSNCNSCNVWCRVGNLPSAMKGTIDGNIREINIADRALRKACRIERKLQSGNLRNARRTKLKERFDDLSWDVRTSILVTGGNRRESGDPRFRYPSGVMVRLFEQYNVTNYNDLLLAINRPILDEYGVSSMSELFQAIQDRKAREIEMAFNNGKLTQEELNYYAFSLTNLGWTNIDIFLKLTPNQIANVNIEIPRSPQVDVRMVFPKYRVVMPPSDGDNTSHAFNNVPKDTKAYIVVVKYENAKPAVAVREVKVQSGSYEVELEECTLEEMKTKLAMVNTWR